MVVGLLPVDLEGMILYGQAVKSLNTTPQVGVSVRGNGLGPSENNAMFKGHMVHSQAYFTRSIVRSK